MEYSFSGVEIHCKFSPGGVILFDIFLFRFVLMLQAVFPWGQAQIFLE